MLNGATRKGILNLPFETRFYGRLGEKCCRQLLKRIWCRIFLYFTGLEIFEKQTDFGVGTREKLAEGVDVRNFQDIILNNLQLTLACYPFFPQNILIRLNYRR